MQKARRHPLRDSDFLDASHFRVYFIPLSGYFSPFPHGTIRYRSLHFFSLGWWSTRIRAGLHVSDLTQEIPTVRHPFDYGALTLSGRPFQDRSSRVTTIGYWAPTTPHNEVRFGLFPFRSPLLRESRLISFRSATLDVSVRRVLSPRAFLSSPVWS